jgi:DNA polymerase III alpha subunit (gram-positive type)
MIDNTYSETISVLKKSNEGIALSNTNKQTSAWQTPQAEKLSRADLHIRSTYSDGIPTIEQILKHTELHTDLDVIAITDHNVIDSSLRARDLWARGSYRFDFIVGEETKDICWHFLLKSIYPHT